MNLNFLTAVFFAEIPKVVVTLISNSSHILRGDTFTLHCGIEGDPHIGWRYSWFRNGDYFHPVSSGPEYRVRQARQSHSGNYSCRGTLTRASLTSDISNVVKVTVSGETIYRTTLYAC